MRTTLALHVLTAPHIICSTYAARHTIDEIRHEIALYTNNVSVWTCLARRNGSNSGSSGILLWVPPSEALACKAKLTMFLTRKLLGNY